MDYSNKVPIFTTHGITTIIFDSSSITRCQNFTSDGLIALWNLLMPTVKIGEIALILILLISWKWYHCELRYFKLCIRVGQIYTVEWVLTGFGRRTDGIIAQYIRYNSLTVIPPITGTMNSLHIWWVIDCSIFSQSS